MQKKMVVWLYQELPVLVSQGVFPQSTADKIREHYGDIKGSDKKWFVIVLCSVVGAILIGLGIILLFAHNWEEFSRPLRTVLSLLPLIIGQGLAIWVVIRRSSSHALKEGVATFLSLMVGASIALISQTYHIPDDTQTFLFKWMLLILPLTYFMQATIPAAIFVAGITTWAGQLWTDPLQAFLFWPFVATVVPYFIWSLKQEQYAIRSAILALVLAIGIIFGAGFTLGKTWPGSWIVIYSSLISLLYLLGVWDFRGISSNWQRPFQVIGGLGIFIMTFVLTFRYPWQSLMNRYFYYPEQELSSVSALLDNTLTFFLVGGSLLMFFLYAKRQDWMRALFGALPLLALVGYAFGGTSIDFSMMLFNVYLLCVSVYRLMLGIRMNHLGVINTGMLMLAALILARFFDSEINFIVKGLVFILIGVGFLVTNVVILRRKGGAA